jgi:hypothetical protein
VDIPHPDEIRTLLGKATGKRRAFCCPSRVLWAARWRAHTPFARIVDPTRHGFPHGLMATTGPPAAAAGLFRSQCQASQAAAGCLTITPGSGRAATPDLRDQLVTGPARKTANARCVGRFHG